MTGETYLLLCTLFLSAELRLFWNDGLGGSSSLWDKLFGLGLGSFGRWGILRGFGSGCAVGSFWGAAQFKVQLELLAGFDSLRKLAVNEYET